jgi:hypothetical protein
MTKESGESTEDTALARAKRHARIWGVSGGVCTVLALLAGAFLYGQATASQTTASERGYVIDAQNSLIDSGCQIAGEQADRDPEFHEACTRVAQGKPAVPAAAGIIAPRDGKPGVGIASARRVNRCYVEVELTDGSRSRYGSFCGATGKPGKTGPAGPTGATGGPGADGSDGAQGVGVADVMQSGCNVEVTLTDGTSRTVGPFCGPPLPEYSVNRPDGSAVHCMRDGGSDTAPVYTCTQTRAPTTSPEPTETVTQTETATETQTTTVREPGGLLPTG